MSSSTDPVLVGVVGKPYGLAGHVFVKPESDDPDRFNPGAELFTDDGTKFVVRESRFDGSRLVVAFDGVTDRTGAESIRGTRLSVDASQRRSLGDDEFWPDELVGLAVHLPDGTPIGTVTGYVEGAAQDRLVVAVENGAVEVPFVSALVPHVDVAGGTIVVEPLEGLFTES